MSHTIKYNPEEHIIEIKVQGTVNIEEFKEIASQGVQIAKDEDCFRVLSDYREVTKIDLSTMDIYELPKILSGISALAEVRVSRFRRAIVVMPKDATDANFAETVAANQGQNAKFFLDVEEARKWLLEK